MFEVVGKHLIPLLIEYAGDKRESKLMFTLLRLLTYMTLPADMLFAEADDGIERTVPYVQVNGNKTSFLLLPFFGWEEKWRADASFPAFLSCCVFFLFDFLCR